LYVFTFASSPRGARTRDSISQSQRVVFRIFKRLSFPACLHSFWFTSRPTRAQRARENDAESTETWRMIDSEANERSRFVFSRSLSRLGSVALLVRFFFLLNPFSTGDFTTKSTSTQHKKQRCSSIILTPLAFFFLLLLTSSSNDATK